MILWLDSTGSESVMKIDFIARKDRGIQAIKLADIIQSPKILKDYELID
jgi:hypothetical protein